jgi:hypothetical protein
MPPAPPPKGTSAPLKDWFLAESFDSALGCQQGDESFRSAAHQIVANFDAQARTIADSNKDYDTKREELGKVFDQRYFYDQIVPFGTCIASDDSRLAR